jgi:hypothetical protein
VAPHDENNVAAPFLDVLFSDTLSYDAPLVRR